MKIFKILLISLFLAYYPFLSIATIFVKCKTEIRQSVKKEGVISSGICLPDGWYNNLIGAGATFSEAWEDARVVCSQMITTIIDEHGRAGKTTWPDNTGYCDLTECERVDLTKVKYDNWGCGCMERREEPCKIISRWPVPYGWQINVFNTLFKSNAQYCIETARALHKPSSVYCGPGIPE